MLNDARSVAPDDVVRADVCIVGGGPAGLTLADALRSGGMSVLLLESGGPSASAMSDPSSLDLAKGRSVGHTYFPLHTTRVRGLGGTSNHWYHDVGFRTRALDAVDFERREGVPHSGWPITKQDLDPWYGKARGVLGLQAADTDPQELAGRTGRPLLPVGPTVVTTLFHLSDTEVFPRLAATLAADRGLHVMQHATVTEILTDAGGQHVTGLTVTAAPGRTFGIEAGRYVLACGGIENARLLLASTTGRPSGVGNQHDLVGRFFQEHLAVRSGDWWPSGRGLTGTDTLYDALEVDGTRFHAKLAPSPEVVRERGLLNTTFFLDPMSRARASSATASAVALKHALVDRPLSNGLVAHARTVLSGAPQIARVAGGVLAGRRGRPVQPALRQLRCMAEQAPNPLSRVRLDDTRRDALGMPRAVLDWRLTELDRVSIRRAQDVVAAAVQAAGLGTVTRLLGDEAPAAQVRGQWHHMGTTRMAAEPREGVLDPDLRVHGMTNLYVCGSSAFPTSGYANPTLTIIALALRLAAHLRAGRGGT